MSIVTALSRETDRRLRRILTATHPVAVDSRFSSLQRWANSPERYVAVAAHLCETIWTVARVLPDDASELVCLQEDMPMSGLIALDTLWEALSENDENSFLGLLVETFIESGTDVDLLAGLTVLSLGMATHLGGWVWQD